MTKVSIATWNVNSIRARLNVLLNWLKKKKPYILLLQELKAQKNDIPRTELEELNYNFITFGQKAYNGVAILSKYPVSDITYNLPNFDQDKQSRYIEGFINLDKKGIRVASIYAPNGNPINSEKYSYKIEWLKKFCSISPSIHIKQKTRNVFGHKPFTKENNKKVKDVYSFGY